MDALVDRDFDDLTQTCVLRAVKKKGEHTLEEIGEIFKLTRERIRQIEAEVLRRMRRLPVVNHLSDERRKDVNAGEAKEALREIARVHGRDSLRAGAQLAGLSWSTFSLLEKQDKITPIAEERIQSALDRVRAGEKLSALRAENRKPEQKPAQQKQQRSPLSSITLDKMPRIIAVIEALGGLERAERIAKALR
jgi:hypothetical protein